MVSRLIWPLVILQIATVAAIIFLLRVFFYRQLDIGMKKIRRLDQENLKKEADLNEKLHKLDKEWNAKIAKAEREATRIVEEAREELKRMREEERARAKDETKKIIANARQERDRLIREARQEIYDKAIGFSKNIFRRIFSEEELKEIKSRVSKEVVNYLVGSEEVGELLKVGKSVEVVSADPLTEADKKYILKVIKDKVKGKMDIKFSVDRDILGGLTLKVGERIIDGSIVYRIGKAAQDLREELK